MSRTSGGSRSPPVMPAPGRKTLQEERQNNLGLAAVAVAAVAPPASAAPTAPAPAAQASAAAPPQAGGEEEGGECETANSGTTSSSTIKMPPPPSPPAHLPAPPPPPAPSPRGSTGSSGAGGQYDDNEEDAELHAEWYLPAPVPPAPPPPPWRAEVDEQQQQQQQQSAAWAWPPPPLHLPPSSAPAVRKLPPSPVGRKRTANEAASAAAEGAAAAGADPALDAAPASAADGGKEEFIMPPPLPAAPPQKKKRRRKKKRQKKQEGGEGGSGDDEFSASAADSSAVGGASNVGTGDGDDDFESTLWAFLDSHALKGVHLHPSGKPKQKTLRAISGGTGQEAARLVVVPAKTEATFAAENRNRKLQSKRQKLDPAELVRRQMTFNRNVLGHCEESGVRFVLLDDTATTHHKLESLLGRNEAMLTQSLIVPKVDPSWEGRFQTLLRQVDVRRRDLESRHQRLLPPDPYIPNQGYYYCDLPPPDAVGTPPAKTEPQETASLDDPLAMVALEEQISLFQETLQHLTDQQKSVAGQLKDVALRRDQVVASSRGLESDALSLRARLVKQTVLRDELKTSLLKSQRILSRLVRVDGGDAMTVQEIAELTLQPLQNNHHQVVDGDEESVCTINKAQEEISHYFGTKATATPAHAAGKEQHSAKEEKRRNSFKERETDDEGVVFALHEDGAPPAPMSLSCPPNLVPSSENLVYFWRIKEGAVNKRLGTFLPCIHSQDVLLSILNLSAREVLALDPYDPSSRHRREAFWNTILDFRLLSTTATEPSDGSKTHSGPGSTHSEGSSNSMITAVDPNVSLCPYELSGQCADHFCPYQHFQKRPIGRVLPRELLPLPPLKLLKDQAALDDEHHQAKEKKVAVSKPAALKLQSPIAREKPTKDSEEPKDASAFVDNEDFVSLPAFQGCKFEDSYDIEPEAGDEKCHDELVRVREQLCQATEAEKDALLPFWWMERGQAPVSTSLTGKQTSFSCIIGVFGFPYSEEETASSLAGLDFPKDFFEACILLGKIVDWSRLSVHAGRFAIAETLNDKFHEGMKVWKKEDRTPIYFFRFACSKVLQALRRARRSAFAYNNSGENAFLCAYDSQVKMCLCSSFVQQMRGDLLHQKLHTPFKKWAVDSKRLVSPFPGSTDDENAARDNSQPAVDEGPIRLIKTGLLDPPSKTNKDATPDIFRWCFIELINDVESIRRRSLSAYRKSSVRRLVDDVLEPCWATVKQVLLQHKQVSTSGDDNPVLLSITIQIGYVVLRVLSSAANLIHAPVIVGPSKNEMSELFSVVDRILMSLHRMELPCMDFLLAPLFATSISLACTLQMYDRVQQRLELLLVTSKLPDRSLSFMHLSEILWSQFVQLRLSLPLYNQLPQGKRTKDPIPPPSFELPANVSEGNVALAVRVAKLEIHLHHIDLDCDWNLVRELSERSRTKRLAPDGDNIALDLHESCIILLHSLYKGVKLKLQPANTSLNLRETYGTPLPLRPSIPRSLLLAGANLTSLNLNSCSLSRLPHHFGAYFPSLLILELNDNTLGELPPTLALMSNLEVLCVDSNKLARLPSSFRFPKLTKFTARGNRLTELPVSLKDCKALEILELGKNPLKSDDHIGALAAQLPKLRVLNWKE